MTPTKKKNEKDIRRTLEKIRTDWYSIIIGETILREFFETLTDEQKEKLKEKK